MTPAEFIAKWGPGGPAYALNEEQGAQSHFLDLCELLDVPKPGSAGLADEYLFERRSLQLGEARGYADVFYRDHFAWENKAPGKNLDAALRQLQQYSLALANPPLLVVCDRLTIRIHTQFNGHPSETHTARLDQLAEGDRVYMTTASGRRYAATVTGVGPSIAGDDLLRVEFDDRTALNASPGSTLRRVWSADAMRRCYDEALARMSGAQLID